MAETWRVVLASGEVREVRVEALDNGGFEARWGDCDVESDDSEHDAVLWLTSCFSWGAVEILAPGEITRAELRAQAFREGAEAMREALRAETCRVLENAGVAIVPHIIADLADAAIHTLPVPPCPEVSR